MYFSFINPYSTLNALRRGVLARVEPPGRGQTNNDPYMAISKRLKLVRSGSESELFSCQLGLARFGLGQSLGAELVGDSFTAYVFTRDSGEIERYSWVHMRGISIIALFGDAYEKIGTIQRRLAWPLHKDDTLFQSGRPTGLNIYFYFSLSIVQVEEDQSFRRRYVFSLVCFELLFHISLSFTRGVYGINHSPTI